MTDLTNHALIFVYANGETAVYVVYEGYAYQPSGETVQLPEPGDGCEVVVMPVPDVSDPQAYTTRCGDALAREGRRRAEKATVEPVGAMRCAWAAVGATAAVLALWGLVIGG